MIALGIKLLEVESTNLLVDMVMGRFEVNVSCRSIMGKFGRLLLKDFSAVCAPRRKF